jgi:hypothetical protein
VAQVHEDLREEVKSMIAAEIGQMHNQNLNRFGLIEKGLSEMRERIIGIDSNGSGRRPGVLQRQDAVLGELKDGQEKMKLGQEQMKSNIETLVRRSQSWNKKNVWELAKWIIGGLGALTSVLLAMWIGHKMGWK